MPEIDSFRAEQNIISILLKEPQLIYEVASQISADYFTNDPNRKHNKALFLIFDYISRKKDIEELEFDSMTILSVAEEHEHLNKALKKIFDKKEDFVKYIETLRETPIDPSNLDIHLEKLKKINISNDLYQELNEFQDNLLEFYKEWEQEQIISKAESRILDVSNRYNAGEDKVFVKANKDRVERYKKRKPNFNDFSGLPMHLERVNRFSTGLLKKGSTTVINAQSNVGKSMFLKNVAKFLAIDNDIPVYLGANEQNIKEQEDRLIQEITGLPTIIIENNLFNADREYVDVDGKKFNVKECRDKVFEAVELIDDSPLYLDKVSGYTPSILVQRAKYFKKRHNIQCFIWDYVKPSTSTSISDGQMRFWLAEVVRSLKEDIADKLGIATLTASQAKTYEWWLSAESYGIEKYSTAFCLLRELDSNEKKTIEGDYGFTVKKNRYGKTHPNPKQNWIDLKFNEEYLRFEEV